MLNKIMKSTRSNRSRICNPIQEYDEVAGTPEPSANSLKKGLDKLRKNIKLGAGILNTESHSSRSRVRGIEMKAPVQNRRKTELTIVGEIAMKDIVGKKKKKGVRFNDEEAEANNRKNTKSIFYLST